MSGYKKSLFMIVGKDNIIQDKFELLKRTFQIVGIDIYTSWKTNLQNFKSDIENTEPKVIFALGREVSTFFNITENFKFNINPDYNKIIVGIYAPEEVSDDIFVNQLLQIEKRIESIRNKTFINFHHHNQFSLRDGLGTEKDIAKFLDSLKSPGFSLTNHGNINCHYRQYKAAKEYGLKPIFGTEIYYNQFRDKIIEYLGDDSKESTQERKKLGEFTYHLTVIAMNQQGYYNLISMNNEALMTSFYKFPLIDDKLLLKYKEGLAIFSGCGGSYISVNLFQDSKAAYEKADFFRQNFPDNFYVELMSTAYEHQKFLNQRLVNLSKDLHLPTIVTNDSHYIKHNHHKIHDILLLAGTDTTLEDLTDPATKVWTFSVKDLYIKTPSELYQDLDFLKTDEYNEDILRQSISNVHKVFAKVEPFEIDTSFKYPKLSDEDSIKLLQRLIAEGLKKRNIVLDDAIKERLQEEYETITKMGFTDYFLCLQDLLNHIKDNYGRYSVGPGRGSAAASLIAYLIGITDINPMKDKLMLFERFLSPGRKDPVDIDSDLSPRIRPKVLEYAIERYGRNNVFSVGTHGTIKLKTAIHDVLKALGADFTEILSYTKKIPSNVELEYMDMDFVIEQLPFLNDLFKKYPDALEAVAELRNKLRSYGQHAGGLVISGVDITKNLPLAKTSTGQYVTANTEGGEYHEITQLGYVKYDVLGLTTIDNVNDTSDLIKKNHNIYPDWDEIENNQEKYKEMFSILHDGDSFGIFQFNSQLGVSYCKYMKPNDLEDLCAASALLRPGPLDQKAHTTYANRKNGFEAIEMPECLKPYLELTYGVLVYQEQFIRIAQDLCGFTKEQGSAFRKDLMKYEKSVEGEKLRRAKIATYKERIVKGLMSHGMTEEESVKWWEYIEAFARYAFNRAHSYSYSIHSYRQLWQKYYYPIEFYTALLNNSSMEELTVVVKNMMKFKARRFDKDGNKTEFSIKILQPSLIAMNPLFAIEENSIRHGLTFVKYISPESYELFKLFTKEELLDFNKLIIKKYKKNDKDKFIIDKKVIAALIYSGALDYLNMPRYVLAEVYNKVRKSNVEIITDTKAINELEEFYCGYSLNVINDFSNMRLSIKNRWKNVKSLTDLKENDDLNTDAVDYFVVRTTKSKTSSRGNPYRLISADNMEEIIFPIYIWDNAIEAIQDQKYVGIFKRENGFLKLTRTIKV